MLLLHDGLSVDELESVATALFYPLWDAGFALGQAVRTPDQCLDAAREHLTDLTALLDARGVAGDRSMLERARCRSGRSRAAIRASSLDA